MRLVRMTDAQYEKLREVLGPDFAPPKPQRSKPVRQVTVDSRFNDCELVKLYRTIRRLEASPKWKYKTFLVRFALGTGLRESEMLRLRFARDPKDDDLAECHRNGVITVRNAKGGKTRDARCIPELQPHYIAHIEWMLDNTEGDPNEPLIPLFGKEYERTTLWRWWRQVLAQVPDIRQLRLHDARHTYGSWELMRLQEAEVNGLMGHIKPDVFRKHYAGILAELVYEKKQVPEWYRAALGRFA